MYQTEYINVKKKKKKRRRSKKIRKKIKIECQTTNRSYNYIRCNPIVHECDVVRKHSHVLRSTHTHTHIIYINAIYFILLSAISSLLSHNLLHSFSLHNLVHLQKLRYLSTTEKEEEEKKRKENMLNQKRRFYKSICDSLQNGNGSHYLPLSLSLSFPILYICISCTAYVEAFSTFTYVLFSIGFFSISLVILY